jgi:hypothetical protein
MPSVLFVFFCSWYENSGSWSLGRHKCRRKDNFKRKLKELGYDDMNCIHLAHNSDQLRTLYMRNN